MAESRSQWTIKVSSIDWKQRAVVDSSEPTYTARFKLASGTLVGRVVVDGDKSLRGVGDLWDETEMAL